MELTELSAAVLKELEGRGWKIERSTSREPLLPAAIGARYPRIPGELLSFLQSIDSCTNANEDIWFLCRADFVRGDEGFRWNEFEAMTLEYDHEAEYKAQVRAFWDRHFPFMMAAHSDYDYLAVSLDERSFGKVVHGCGDDFLEPSDVAPSFAAFLEQFKKFVASGRDDYPLGNFV
jgi:hypothetical protein